MLKDITLGQFFPADTPVHRLDPRTKLLCVILYIVALFSAKSVLTYGIMIAVLTVSVLVSKVPFKSLTKGLKPVYFVVAFTAIMNMFFTAGTPVADVWLLLYWPLFGLGFSPVRRWRTCGCCGASHGRASLPPCRWCCGSFCSSWARS